MTATKLRIIPRNAKRWLGFCFKGVAGSVEVDFRELVIREPCEQRQQLVFQGFDKIPSISKDNSPDG